MDPNNPDGVALISASHPANTNPKTKKKAAKRKPKAKKKTKSKRPAKKAKAPKRKAAKAKKPARKSKAKRPAKSTKAGVVIRTERLDMRLSKDEKRKVNAKAKKLKQTITGVVLEAIAKL